MLKRSTICSIVLVLLLAPLFRAAAAPGGGAAVGTVPTLLASSGKQNGAYEECTLGDALADAMTRHTEAEIALVNGGRLKGNILQGPVTEADIAEAVEDCEVAVVTVSAGDLRAMLEICLSHVVTDGKGGYDADASAGPLFPQISGFRVTYDPSAEPMARVSRLTVGDGKTEEDAGRMLKLALPLPLCEGELAAFCSGAAGTDETLLSLLKTYIASGMDDYYTPPKRIVPQGIRSSIFPDRYAVFTLVAVCVLFLILLLPLGKKLHLLGKKKDSSKGETSDP